MLKIPQLISNKPISLTTVVVAMSGGVDSSTIAAYLAHLGYNVIGITLKLYNSKEISSSKSCCAGTDINDAKEVANMYNFPHYVMDYEKTFKEEVIEDFINNYKQGRTPIPCIKCNQTVKFRDLYKVAKNLLADALVTGHYIKRIEQNSGIELHQAKDLKKDQSYFLFNITSEQLKFLRFPLGDFTKDEIRNLAKHLNLTVAEKKESQDICFVKGKSYRDLIDKYSNNIAKKGDILYFDGTKLGTHYGITNYTVGQRHGLGISHSEPLYVISINSKKNEIIVGPQAKLGKTFFHIKIENFLIKDYTTLLNVQIKIRSGIQKLNAKITETTEDNVLKVEILDEKQKYAISPGQACVIYKSTRILGGGWIIQ